MNLSSNEKDMKYSIITVNYNNREGLRRTIESVVNQSYQDFEYIVIDGGSTDGSREVIQKYSEYIDYWVSEPDCGVYHAMNKGIKVAHGEHLIFMNSGDTFYDQKVLESSLPYLLSDIVQGVAKNSDLSETPLCLVNIPDSEKPFSPSLHHQSCFFNKKLFETAQYDEHYGIVADWKFYIEQIVFHHASYSVMPVVVAIYEGGGISDQQKELDFEERREVIEVMCRQLKEQGAYAQHETVMQHLMFTCKMRFLLNRSLLDVDKYLDTFPESSALYKYYPFSRKQQFLFLLAACRFRHLLKIILSHS